jgi:hypothetical protein
VDFASSSEDGISDSVTGDFSWLLLCELDSSVRGTCSCCDGADEDGELGGGGVFSIGRCDGYHASMLDKWKL